MHLRKPSPATIIASIALFFSLGGTAIAAHHYLIESTKQIKPSVLKKLTGKTGATGKEGPAGKEGAAGKEGKEGQKGENGSAVAYAAVSAAGVLDTSHSKNVSAASRIAEGGYCLKTTVPVSNASGMIDTGEAEDIGEVAGIILAGQDPKNFIGILCPAGDNVLVVVREKGTAKSIAFWVNFN